MVVVANALNDLEILEKIKYIKNGSYMYYHFPGKEEYLNNFERPMPAGHRTECHEMKYMKKRSKRFMNLEKENFTGESLIPYGY